MQAITKNPALFNKKLLPLIKRYFFFSGSTVHFSAFIVLFLSAPFMFIFYNSTVYVFFQLFLLSTIVLTNSYGVNEDYILSMLPISKKQSVFVRCCHLFFVQSIVFATMIAMSFLTSFTINTGLYAQNKHLAISIIVLSIAVLNLSFIIFSFCKTGERAKPLPVLIGTAALFVLPVTLNLLYSSSIPIFQAAVNNYHLSIVTLGISCAVFVVATAVATIIATKYCHRKDFNPSIAFATAKKPVDTLDDKADSVDKDKDGFFLTAYLSLLRMFRVRPTVVMLIRKDCKLSNLKALLILSALMFALSYVPYMNMFMTIVHVGSILTIVCYLFVETGDFRASKLLPITIKDYILSKIILIFSLQAICFFASYAAFSILNIWNITPGFLQDTVGFRFFATLFVAHALLNFVFLSLIFRYPHKIRAYSIGIIVYVTAMIIGNSLEYTLPHFYQQLLVVLASFLFFVLLSLLTWLTTKKCKTEV